MAQGSDPEGCWGMHIYCPFAGYRGIHFVCCDDSFGLVEGRGDGVRGAFPERAPESEYSRVLQSQGDVGEEARGLGLREC